MEDELKDCPWCGQATRFYLQKDGSIICGACKREVSDGSRRVEQKGRDEGIS